MHFFVKKKLDIFIDSKLRLLLLWIKIDLDGNWEWPKNFI